MPSQNKIWVCRELQQARRSIQEHICWSAYTSQSRGGCFLGCYMAPFHQTPVSSICALQGFALSGQTLPVLIDDSCGEPTLYVTRQCTRLILKCTKSNFLRFTTALSVLLLAKEGLLRGPEPVSAALELGSSPWEADLLCRRLNTDPLACTACTSYRKLHSHLSRFGKIKCCHCLTQVGR